MANGVICRHKNPDKILFIQNIAASSSDIPHIPIRYPPFPWSDTDSMIKNAASLRIRTQSYSLSRIEGSLLRIKRQLIRIKGIGLCVKGIGLRIKNLRNVLFVSQKCHILCPQVTSSRINSTQISTLATTDEYWKNFISHDSKTIYVCKNIYLSCTDQ